MSLLIRSLLAVLLCATIKDVRALKCEDDMAKWFLANGEWTGDIEAKPNNQRIIVDRKLMAFNETWNSYKVIVRKGRATGEVRFFPRAGFREPGAFAIRASRLNYDTSFLGNMRLRMTIRPDDLDEISQIINQAYPCLDTGNFYPNHAVVVTFLCMLHVPDRKYRDTFQVIVTGNYKRTFAIVQYHQLHGAHTLQFGFLERLGRKKYRFTGRNRRDNAEELLQSTNGIRKGIWVFDITDSVPRTPEHCNKQADECTVTDNGLVHSFDGVTQVAPPEFLSVLASSQLDFADECNFENRIRMEVHGQVKYFEFFMGSISDANPQDRFYFTFERKEGKATLRGPNKRTAEILTYPYTWMQGSKKIIIRKITQGWKLVSEDCDYEMIYRPEGQEPVYRLKTGPKFAGKLDGYCENFDGDIRNDDDDEF